jgi:2',3'-cyclic-nucleotide 2'-phosphodiesterase/3'-nucleotidase
MKTFNLQILQTSDVHGYVYPTSYIDGSNQPMGLAKIQTKIKSIEQPGRLLFDTGDIIQGSPLTYYYTKQQDRHIHPIASVINQMNYDYITIGNHEFNYGLSTLHDYVDHVDATILNGNLLAQDTEQPFVGMSYDVRTFERDLKIGIVGVTTHYIPNWEQPSHIKGLVIEDAFHKTKEIVQIIKDTVDYIIVSYHGGFEKNLETWEFNVDDTGENQGAKMLEQIPEIDLLLTGHQHRKLFGKTANTTYVQPGFNGQILAEINIEFTKQTTGWSHQTSGRLHDVKEVSPDQTILDMLQSFEDQTQTYLDTPVGTLDHDMLITNQLEARLHKHPLVTLINQIQLEYSNADISICSLGNGVSGFKKQITIRDIIGTYQFPNTLVIKDMTGSDIKRAMEKTAEFFDIKHQQIVIHEDYSDPKLQLYAYDMYDPISYTIVVENPIGNRVEDIQFHGEPLDPKRHYKVVMNNYRASGGGDYQFIKNCPIILDTQQEVIELIIDYIVTKKHIVIPETNNINVLKKR